MSVRMYADITFSNPRIIWAIVPDTLNPQIIHVNRGALMFTTLADDLQIYSACFEVTKDYNK